MTGFDEKGVFYFYRGRVALYALLRALNIEAGDEVIIPGFTCIAVPSPIIGIGARPVYVDIDPETYNLDPNALEAKITARSKAIIAQHSYGIPCQMDAIMTIAKRHRLTVIEDCCHVWGSRYRGRELGSMGAAAFYSYDPGKPFIVGMGGAATVSSQELRAKVEATYGRFRMPGALETAKLNIQYFAYRLTRNPRLFWVIRDFYRFLSKKGIAIATWTPDTLGGTLGPDYEKALPASLRSRLSAMIRDGDRVILRHKRLAALYEQGLAALGIPGLRQSEDCQAVLICYPLQARDKARLLDEARKKRVEVGDAFSSPVHPLTETQWSSVGYQKGECPVAEEVSKRIVTLPAHAGVTPREVERTLEFLGRMRDRGLLCLDVEENDRCGAAGVIKEASNA